MRLCYQRLWPAVILGLLLPGTLPGTAAQAAPSFAAPAFQQVWERTDKPVADGRVARSWFWGPTAGFTTMEPDRDAPGGMRRVQYFDKTRMEINNPAGDPTQPFFVTNGLLATELMTGRMQVGNDAFAAGCPAAIPLASDTDDTTAPTYATFGQLLNRPKSNQVGQVATATVDGSGQVGADPGKASVAGVDLVYYEPLTGRNIPRVFWEFLHESGPIYQNGQYQTGALNDPWFVASGLPLTEPYWARVKIAGARHDVLIQAYERRILTYIPDYNGSGFSVQMGNVGQHYYDWRYRGAGCAATGTPAPPPATSATLPRYAIDPLAVRSPAATAAMSTAGVQLVRVDVGWPILETQDTSPPTYHWDRYDTVISQLTAAGIQVLFSIQGCPAWACTNIDGPLDKAPPARFGQFMAAAATRYSAPPYNVHFWEFLNEPDTTNPPNHQYGFGMHGDQYAALLQAAVPGLRAVDPQARVLLGGMGYEWFMDEQPPGPFNRNWLHDVVAAGGAPYFDYVNFHYYPTNPHWPSIADKAAALTQLEQSLGINKPLVCTEVATTSSSDPRWAPPGWPAGSEEVQSRYVGRMFAEGLAAGLQSITWFSLQDRATGPGAWEIFRQAGLLRVDGSYKPALSAYHTVTQQIGARPFLRRLDAQALGGAGLTGYAFGTAGDQVWVVWSPSGQVQSLAPTGVRLGPAADMLGAALTVNGGALAVGANPVYLQVQSSP